jgi:ribokinase
MTSKLMTRIPVAILGAAAMDWVAHVKQMPTLDGIAYADQYFPMPGGSGGNIAVGVARLGHGVRFMGVLGGDEAGHILMDAFIEAGVETTAILIDQSQRSAACFIAVDERGERLIFSLGGTALYDRADQILPDWLKGVRLLLIADAHPEVAVASMDCLDPDACVIFNPGGLMASAGSDYLKPFLQRCDILITNHQEAQVMTGMGEVEEAARELARRGPGVIMITLGSKGALVLENGHFSSVAAITPRKVIDTTGAGDAFVDGVIAGYLEGMTWVDAAHLGCAVASIKIGHVGARGGLPDREQVKSLMSTSVTNSFRQR